MDIPESHYNILKIYLGDSIKKYNPVKTSELIDKYIREGNTKAEIARFLGMSQGRVSQLRPERKLTKEELVEAMRGPKLSHVKLAKKLGTTKDRVRYAIQRFGLILMLFLNVGLFAETKISILKQDQVGFDDKDTFTLKVEYQLRGDLFLVSAGDFSHVVDRKVYIENLTKFLDWAEKSKGVGISKNIGVYKDSFILKNNLYENMYVHYRMAYLLKEHMLMLVFKNEYYTPNHQIMTIEQVKEVLLAISDENVAKLKKLEETLK
jgi:hypothetical protein